MVFFVGAIVGLNVFIRAALQGGERKEIQKIEAPQIQRAIATVRDSASENDLVAEDPRENNIVEQKGRESDHAQLQWDLYMEKVLMKSKAVKQMKEREIFKDIHKTPEELLSRIQLIDNQIQRYENQSRQKPQDEYALDNLQSLYMLKSTLTVLEESISQ